MDIARRTSELVETKEIYDEIRRVSHPLQTGIDLDPLLDLIGDARFVLLGEASHGTSEYYQWRARLSQRLIREKGFSFIAVEGDWPDCYDINRYIKGYPGSKDNAEGVLHTFERWPTWMWANWEVAALAEWMKKYNSDRQEKAGFYGLDVYSLWESMESIIGYLHGKDPEMVKLAYEAYRCFEPYGEDEQRYALSTRMVTEDCEDEVIDLLLEMRKKSRRFDSDPEAAFSAEQNALVMVNAERYYRAMVRSNSNSWNVRDQHMMDTLDRLMDYHGPESKAIVWAHNTHIGDARFTDMAEAGMVNIGQLAREEHGDENVILAGFSCYSGSVIAGRHWDAPMQVMDVPKARHGSWEALLHKAGSENKLLILPAARQSEAMTNSRGHRAIGVVYQPERESFGNYVPTILAERYDALLYIDETTALHPLHIEPRKEGPPETYPWGL